MMSKSFSDAPKRRRIDHSASLTTNASSWSLASSKPFPSRHIALLRSLSVGSGRPTYVFQHAQPSAHFTTPWYSCSHRLHVYHCNHLAFLASMPKFLSSASSRKIFACSARHDTCAKPAVPRHEHPRTRPSFVFQWRACVQM